MPLALTCTCGARLEIDDKFAGQTINCPDCQKPLQAPTLPAARRRTSGLALTSFILALTLAFTIVGTVAAIFVGIAALLQISRHRDRVVGKGFAVAGIVIGVIMTASTVFALSSFELFGLTGMMSDAQWSGKLDYPASLEVIRDNEGFAIKRPTEQWGVYRSSSARNADNFDRWVVDDLLLVLPREDAVILCYSQRVPRDAGIVKCKDEFLNSFASMHKVGISGSKSGGGFSRAHVKLTDEKWVPKKNNLDMVDLHIDRRGAGEDKDYLVRILKRDGDDRMFVIICGVKKGHMNRMEGQFRDSLDSFRFLNNGW